jgi:hypothetical protein
MAAFESLRETAVILRRCPAVLLGMLTFAILTAWWIYSEPTTVFFAFSAAVVPFLYGGVYGAVEETLDLEGGGVVGASSFLRNGIDNYPVLIVGISLKYAAFWGLLTVGIGIIEGFGEFSGFLVAWFDVSIVLLSMSIVVSVTIVSGVLLLFVFQFFGVAVVVQGREGIRGGTVEGFKDSYRFVNEHTGSVAEYMAVSLSLFLVPSAVAVFMAEDITKTYLTLPILAYLSVAWGIYYTYRVVYYRSVLSSP